MAIAFVSKAPYRATMNPVTTVALAEMHARQSAILSWLWIDRSRAKLLKSACPSRLGSPSSAPDGLFYEEAAVLSIARLRLSAAANL